MKFIKLSNIDLHTFVDDEDYERLIIWSWSLAGNCVRRGTPRKMITITNEIMGTRNIRYDHKDRNYLNNQKDNLRAATRSQNGANRKFHVNNKSGYRGVSWYTTRGMWRATIKVNGKTIHLGLFTSKEDAAREYNSAALSYFKEFAVLNIL